MNQIRFGVEKTDPAERSLSMTKEIQQTQRTNQSRRTVSRRSQAQSPREDSNEVGEL